MSHPQEVMAPEQINLRAATDPNVSCANCANWQQGMCAVLGMPTEPTMVSDAYTPMQASAAPDMMSMLFGGGNAPGPGT